MPICPYCNSDIHIADFFEFHPKTNKKGDVKHRDFFFKGEFITASNRPTYKMWSCPSCDKILGFSEHPWFKS